MDDKLNIWSVGITHNCEAAHRLAHVNAPPKCRAIHGHSWLINVTMTATRLDERGLSVEFGMFKRAWRQLLDDEYDHALWLERGDPLIALLATLPEQRVKVLDVAPTTEEMARLFHGLAAQVLRDLVGLGLVAENVRVARVDIQETRVNSAGYQAGAEGTR